MAMSIQVVVLDRPYLDARLYGGSGILLTGDDGDNIAISVGTGDYAKEVVAFLNGLAEKYRHEPTERALQKVRTANLMARLDASLELETPSMAAE